MFEAASAEGAERSRVARLMAAAGAPVRVLDNADVIKVGWVVFR